MLSIQSLIQYMEYKTLHNQQHKCKNDIKLLLKKYKKSDYIQYIIQKSNFAFKNKYYLYLNKNITFFIQLWKPFDSFNINKNYKHILIKILHGELTKITVRKTYKLIDMTYLPCHHVEEIKDNNKQINYIYNNNDTYTITLIIYIH